MGRAAAIEAGIDSAQYAQFRANSPVGQFSEIPSSNVVLFPPQMTLESDLGVISTIQSGPLLRRPHWPRRYGDPKLAVFRANEQLKRLGADRTTRNALFTRDGEFRHVDTSGKDILGMHPDDAFEYIIGVIGPELEAIGIFLDEPTTGERPFNAHGEKHLRNTYEGAETLLRNAGHIGKPDRFRKKDFQYSKRLTPDRIARQAAIVAALHDIGYLVDPEHHPLASVYLAEKIFPQLAANEREWAEIRRGIILHEGDNIRSLLVSAGVATHEQAVGVLARENPVVPAIALADKRDQNKDRVRDEDQVLRQKEIFVDPRSFLEDPHVEVNLLTEISDMGWATDTRDRHTGGPIVGFRVVNQFSQALTAEQAQRFEHYTTPRSSRPGVKAAVSPRTREAYLNEGISYFNSLVQRNLEIGTFRIVGMALNSFALNPDQEKAEFVYVDAEKKPISFSISFYRDSLDSDIDTFWNTYVPEEVQAKRSPEDLKI